MKPKILVIVSTTRQNRQGQKVAQWYLTEASKAAPDVEFEMFDLAELKLSFFDEPIDPLMASMQGKYTKQQQELADLIDAADGFVIVAAEYNHGVPAPLKNMLDHLAPHVWRRKAVAYVGYGVRGAFWSIGSLLPTMQYLGVMSIMDSINIRSVWEAFDEKGNLKPEYAIGDVDRQLKEFLWWVRALKAQREKTES